MGGWVDGFIVKWLYCYGSACILVGKKYEES